MAKKSTNQIGSWAFMLGVIVAVVLGFLGNWLRNYPATQSWLFIALIVIGIIVGLVNITGEESRSFLMTSAIMVFVSWAGASTLNAIAGSMWVLAALVSVFQALNVLFIPATIIVAMRAVFALARD